MLDISKSVTYIFDDPDWVTKIGILLVVGLAAGILMPVLFLGLVFVAAQVGWSVQLLRNMRAGEPNPMPDWSDFGQKISLGAQPMIAGVLYFLPIILISCFLYVPAILAGGASEDAAGLLASGASCLLVPLMILYGVAVAIFYSMGLIRYSHSEQLNEYFKFSQLWEMFTRDRELTTRFVLYMVLVSVVMGAIGSTGIGGLVTSAFTPPISGHLTGQFASALEGKPKRG